MTPVNIKVNQLTPLNINQISNDLLSSQGSPQNQETQNHNPKNGSFRRRSTTSIKKPIRSKTRTKSIINTNTSQLRQDQKERLIDNFDRVISQKGDLLSSIIAKKDEIIV